MNQHPSPLPVEDQLFLRYRDHGDDRAFTELFLRIEPWILRVLSAYLTDPADARDALQAAWESMLATKQRFDPSRGCFRSLFCTIAVNAALQMLKKGKRSVPLPTNEDGSPRDIPQSTPPDLHLHISEALSHLPARFREVIDLHYFAGFEVKEIADHLHIPEGTVKTWLTRGRARLGRLLAAMGPTLVILDALRAGVWN